MRSSLGLLTGTLSFIYLLVLNGVQMLSMLLYPFSQRAFRAVNRWCARSIWGLWVLLGEVQNGIEVRFVGDRFRPRENAIILPNHQSMADVMVLLSFSWRAGRIGDTKWFVKDVLKYFPTFGWGMKFLDCIFVKRDWARDRGNIGRLFSKYRDAQIPVFLVSFLEGTRRTPEKLASAQKFARDRGLHVPEHTLVPRTKGFLATVEGLREHVDSVYDLTIGYAGDSVPTLIDCFRGRVRRVDVHVRRFAIQELPTENDALEAWVFERFRAKDELLAEMARCGRIPGVEISSKVRVFDWVIPEKRRVRT